MAIQPPLGKNEHAARVFLMLFKLRGQAAGHGGAGALGHLTGLGVLPPGEPQGRRPRFEFRSGLDEGYVQTCGSVLTSVRQPS